MFSMHDKTKIRLCRVAFYALCILPTCAVLGWSVAVRLPSYRRAHEQAITSQLGWQASLRAASTPRPGLLLYEWLELSDPDSGELLARMPFVEIVTSNDELVVRLPQGAIVNGARLDALWDWFQKQSRARGVSAGWHFEAEELIVHLADGDERLKQVSGRIACDEEQSFARCTFLRVVAEDATARPAEVTLARRAKAAGTTLTLDTGSAGLPAGAARAFFAGCDSLGADCLYLGQLSAARDREHWRAQITGRLVHVDLDRLVSAQLPHELSGTAEVQLSDVTIENGRLVTAVGSLRAGPGAISRSLLAAAATHLRIEAAGDAVSGRAARVDYQQLAFGFSLNTQGLTLRGELRKPAGAMLVDTHQVLASQPHEAEPVPLVNLVRALVPYSEVQVPATAETLSLSRALPIPTAAIARETHDAHWQQARRKPQLLPGTKQR